MKDMIVLAIKGFIMGIANIIPGVSGGTLALTLGIYEDFIRAISHFFSKLKENIKFLIPIFIGIGISIISMSRLIDYSYEKFPLPTTMFFMGLVIGGIPLLLKKVKNKKEVKRVSSYVIALITFSIVIILALSDQLFNLSLEVNLSHLNFLGYICLFFVGMVAAGTMVIPGVSGSLVLMLLGYYYPILKVIKGLTKFQNIASNMIIAFIFGIGVLVGIIVIAKIIEYLLAKHSVKTYFGVLGFIFASVIAIPIATINQDITLNFHIFHVVAGVITLILGIIIGYRLGDE